MLDYCDYLGTRVYVYGLTLHLGDTTLGVRCDDLTVNFRGDDILTLERVVGFCEYCIVNKITLSANTAEHFRQIRPNMFGQYGRTGSAILAGPWPNRSVWPNIKFSSEKNGLVRFGRNRVRSITNHYVLFQ